MLPSILLAVLCLILVSLFHRALALRSKVKIAKASGLEYIVLPFAIHPNFLWPVLGDSFLLPLLGKITWIRKTLTFKALHSGDGYTYLRQIHAHLGETYMVISPYSIYIKTASASTITQITSRKTDFRKPLMNYAAVNQFGKSILTSEGEDFKRHKRIVAPAFSEKSNALAFQESVRQAQGLLAFWARAGEGNTKRDIRVADTARDMATLALHVICGAGFGVGQRWKGEIESEDRGGVGRKVVPGFNTDMLANGHRLNLKEALVQTTKGLMWFALLPLGWLAKSPFQTHQKAYEGYREAEQYLIELFEFKKAMIARGENEEGTMDLMAPLIKASELAKPPSDPKHSDNNPTGLTPSEISGNAFIFVLAGHETTARTLYFATIHLALHPEVQTSLQTSLDTILGTSSPTSWSYATTMHALYNSLAGAVMMETLRLTPASTRVPKVATRDEDQAVTLEEEGGREVIIPAGALIHLNTIGAQRNPAYYPHKASKRTRKGDDMDDFVPERWVLDSEYNADSKFPTVATASTRREEVQSTPAIDGDGDGVSNPSFSKKSALFHPRRGAFLAFSDGSRSCPGRRFAEIEVTAVLAVIFQSYTVELDVREWASDEEVRGMGREEKRAVYEKATQRVRALVEGAKVRVLLEIVGGKVPVRFVRRGGELFASVRD